ncbi:MAG: UpxY family transcription antiterminator [Nitrospirae bacterium]|nr:UpxY family transcription antiterminator [Nitrospirota bacterium]
MAQAVTLEHKWYAAYVRSRHEFQVFGRLNKKGVEAFLPTVERLRKWKDRKKLVTFTLFPGYLFIRITEKPQDILNVLKVKGVVRILGSASGGYDPIPDEQIISLKKLVESKESINPYPYLSKGQLVRIRHGPLSGVEGMLIEKLGQHMLVLSVDILRQGVALKIDASEVEKI